MEMVFYKDETCSMIKDDSSDSSVKAVAFPVAFGEDRKVLGAAGRKDNCFIVVVIDRR